MYNSKVVDIVVKVPTGLCPVLQKGSIVIRFKPEWLGTIVIIAVSVLAAHRFGSAVSRAFSDQTDVPLSWQTGELVVASLVALAAFMTALLFSTDLYVDVRFGDAELAELRASFFYVLASAVILGIIGTLAVFATLNVLSSGLSPASSIAAVIFAALAIGCTAGVLRAFDKLNGPEPSIP